MATTTGTDVKTEDEIGPEKEQEKETKDNSNENNASVELYKEAKKEFLKGRQILIRNIPAISKEEINIFLGGFVAKNIEIDKLNSEAWVTLEDDEEGEDVIKELNGVKLLDRVVTVAHAPVDKLLCVAHLPLNFTTEKLHKFASPHGPIIKCFMFRTEDTGESKGYGIVEYGMDLGKTTIAQMKMDWQEEDELKVHCDFIDKNLNLYSKLHSKCLFVDNLPKDFIEVTDLRDIFSKHASPIYCQIVMKEGISLGYGIIEYSDWKDAQTTMKDLNGHKIDDSQLRITYCVPGKSAVAICTRLMSKFDHIKAPSKPSLLPDPVFPCHAVLSHPIVTQLMSQHSDLNKNFKDALQQLQQTYVNQLTKSNKPGLLGPAPSSPMNPLMNPTLQLGLVMLIALQLQTKCLSQEKEIGSLNLLTLLGTDELETEQPLSLLGDPVASQANIILKNLMTQVTSDSSTSLKLKLDSTFNLQNVNLNSLVSLGQITSNMDSASLKLRGKAGLLGEMPQDSGPDGDNYYGGSGGSEYSQNNNSGDPFMRNIEMLAAQNLQSQFGGKSSLLGAAPKPKFGRNTAGLLPDPDTATNSFGYGSGNNFGNSSNNSGYGSQDNYGNGGGYYGGQDDYGNGQYGYNDNYGYNQGEYYDNNSKSSYGQYGQGSQNNDYGSGGSGGGGNFGMQGGGFGNQNMYNSFRRSSDGNEPDYETMAAQAQAYASTPKPQMSSSSQYNPGYGFDNNYDDYNSGFNNNYYYNQSGPGSGYNSGPGSGYSQSGQGSGYNSGPDSGYNSGPGSGYNSGPGSGYNQSGLGSGYNQSGSGYGQSGSGYDHSGTGLGQSAGSGYGQSGSSYNQFGSGYNHVESGYSSRSGQKRSQPEPPGTEPPPLPPSEDMAPPPLPPIRPPGPPGPPGQGRSSLKRTPLGQKRPYSQLLPDPEPSPEFDYIGQHSQGIGGHYAESYRKRMRLDI